MYNRLPGCQPPAGATPLLRFGLPSPPGVVGMVMAPGSASGKPPPSKFLVGPPLVDRQPPSMDPPQYLRPSFVE